MSDEADGFDRLAGKLFQGCLSPESLPEVIASLAVWLQPHPHAIGKPAPSYCPLQGYSRSEENDGKTPCHMHQNDSAATTANAQEQQCAICETLHGNQPDWCRVIDLFVRCRGLRELADQATGWAQTSHVAAILLTDSGQVLDCDFRGESFLRSGHVLRLRGSQLCCANAASQAQFSLALKEAACSGRVANLLLHAPDLPEKRFSLTLTKMQQRPLADGSGMGNGEVRRTREEGGGAMVGGDSTSGVLCLVAPLDGRRIATARQLMDFFGLSAAEARLARAICHGDSVEEYARDQGLRLPTVRTQLSAIFKKTGTERQAALVRLVAGIPVVRET